MGGTVVAGTYICIVKEYIQVPEPDDNGGRKHTLALLF